MAGITLAQAEEKLALWLAAEEKVASGQEYSIGNRTLKRVNLFQIREQIKYWDATVRKLSRGTSGIRVRGITRSH
jgi:hypothetical protein